MDFWKVEISLIKNPQFFWFFSSDGHKFRRLDIFGQTGQISVKPVPLDHENLWHFIIGFIISIHISIIEVVIILDFQPKALP